jgi:hypothetical protein
MRNTINIDARATLPVEPPRINDRRSAVKKRFARQMRVKRGKLPPPPSIKGWDLRAESDIWWFVFIRLLFASLAPPILFGLFIGRPNCTS